MNKEEGAKGLRDSAGINAAISLSGPCELEVRKWQTATRR